LKGGPTTTDISYVLRGAESAICYALPLDKEKIRAFLRKDLPNGRRDHEKDNIITNLKAFDLAIQTTKYLECEGYKAREVFPNFKYREDVPGWEINMIPELSLKLIAVRSGVGNVGLSGNIGLQGYGATIILGCVVTDAILRPTDPLTPDNSFCSKCGMCQKVCAFRMFGSQETESLTIGGHEFTCFKRLSLERCKIVCGGLSGLDKSRQWSTWSPGRYSYPENDKEVMRVLTSAANNASKWPDDGIPIGYEITEYEGYQEILIRLGVNAEKMTEMIKNTKLTCGNCQLICWGDPKETKKNFDILTNSGCVIQHETGKLQVLPPSDADKIFNSMNQKHQKLYYKEIKKKAKDT
jgi:epoxyqueuosine reductase